MTRRRPRPAKDLMTDPVLRERIRLQIGGRRQVFALPLAPATPAPAPEPLRIYLTEQPPFWHRPAFAVSCVTFGFLVGSWLFNWY